MGRRCGSATRTMIASFVLDFHFVTLEYDFITLVRYSGINVNDGLHSLDRWSETPAPKLVRSIRWQSKSVVSR